MYVRKYVCLQRKHLEMSAGYCWNSKMLYKQQFISHLFCSTILVIFIGVHFIANETEKLAHFETAGLLRSSYLLHFGCVLIKFSFLLLLFVTFNAAWGR